MKAERICTNSEEFFHIYSNQLPELWFNVYKQLLKNLLKQQHHQQTSISISSLEKTDNDTDSVNRKQSKFVHDLHKIGLLTSTSTAAADDHHYQSMPKTNESRPAAATAPAPASTVNNNHDENDNQCENSLLKSKLIDCLFRLTLNPTTTQCLLNELHYLTENLHDNNNNSFMMKNSSTIELFNRIEKLCQNYFNQLNIEELFMHDNHTTNNYNNQPHWPYLLNLLHGNLIKFTLIEELKLINENISLILECCTSLLVSTKLPLILQLIWKCINMFLNNNYNHNHRSIGFQLKSLDSKNCILVNSCMLKHIYLFIHSFMNNFAFQLIFGDLN
ncbi:unnamed protein product [Schistosoma turkestanicum]|nr:unnamed protein product [Schistosoma turkestanicum]